MATTTSTAVAPAGEGDDGIPILTLSSSVDSAAVSSPHLHMRDTMEMDTDARGMVDAVSPPSSSFPSLPLIPCCFVRDVDSFLLALSPSIPSSSLRHTPTTASTTPTRTTPLSLHTPPFFPPLPCESPSSPPSQVLVLFLPHLLSLSDRLWCPGRRRQEGGYTT